MIGGLIEYFVIVLLLIFALVMGMVAGNGMGITTGKQTACSSVNLEWVEQSKACMKVTRENLK